MNLDLTEPIVFFDLEATGLNITRDRIVEICVVKVFPDGQRETKKRLINPCIPIPPATTEIHGITDEDVRDAPTFGQVSKSFFEFLEGCDLGGFNVIKFDIPLITEEFKRNGLDFSLDDRRVIDVQRIYHKMEPRTLSAALRFYCNEEHLDAHGSEGDAIASIKVLEAQLEKYSDVPRDVTELDQFCSQRDANSIDRDGKLRWGGGEVVIAFGQKSGMTLRALADTEPGYLKWILRGDFSEEVKEIVAEGLEGRFRQKN